MGPLSLLAPAAAQGVKDVAGGVGNAIGGAASAIGGIFGGSAGETSPIGGAGINAGKSVLTAPNGASYNAGGDPLNATASANYTAQQKALQSNQAFINNGNAANNQAAQLYQQILALEKANAPGVAPTLNLNALNAQAQSKAQGTVNPLYTQYMNQYLQEEAANQQSAQSQNTLNLQSEQASLGNTLAQNTQAQNYAGQQNAATQGNINAQATNYQLNSGNAQNAKIQTLQQAAGQGGLGSSGYGQQQLYNAENAKNIADAQQQGQFQYQRNTSNLSTEDTFAQLTQSSAYAKTGEGEQEAQTNFNLNDYLRQASYNDSQYKQALAASQQQAITATTQQNEAQLVQQQLQALTGGGGKNYAAGEAAYGNVLNPSLGLPSAPSQNSYLAQYGASV